MDAIQSAVAWVMSVMLSVYTPGQKVKHTEAQETFEEGSARLKDASEDLVEVVFDPDTKPLFGGPRGRSQTALLMLAVSKNESHFLKNVDLGIGDHARGDDGKSWCLMQLKIGSGKTVRWNWAENRLPRFGDDPLNLFDGYYGPELIAERRLCFSEGLKVMRLSMNACSKLPLNQRLASYVHGKCDEGGFEGSEERFLTAMRWMESKRTLMKFTESAVLAEWPAWQKSRHDNIVSTRHPDIETLRRRETPMAAETTPSLSQVVYLN